MMTFIELEQTLLRLGLSQTGAAQLLSVAPRTVRRWLEGEEIPGPAEQTFRAWLRLHEKKLAWRPDSVSIAADDQDQIARHKKHAVELIEMLARVEARGGSRLPWKVDHERSRAVLGPMEVTFYTLQSGSFSLGSYTRKDGDPDVERDWEMIEDAAYSIAQELTHRPVTLAFHNRPWRSGIVEQSLAKFPSKDKAIQRACAALGSPGFHDPFIFTGKPTEVLLDKHALRHECQRRKTSAAALRAVAAYVRRHSSLFVRHGPALPTPTQAAQKKQKIESVADEIELLAGSAEQESATYQQFDPLLGALHKLGFFPETALISAVARAFTL